MTDNETPAAEVTEKATVKAQLLQVRRDMAALKAEEDRILTLIKRQGWEDILIETVSVAAGAALGSVAIGG